MFQDALFVPEGHVRDRAMALPLAALVHVVALALLVTVPLLRVGELPQIDISCVMVVPALPATPCRRPESQRCRQQGDQEKQTITNPGFVQNF